MSRQQEFDALLEEIKELSIVLYSFLYKSKVSWGKERTQTACVSLSNGCANFAFNPKFWDKLNQREHLFLILHECYHIFLEHFVRFTEIGQLENAALDIANNHTLLKHFTFDVADLPFLRKNGCWVDTVIPGKVLMEGLSAEEYLLTLQQHKGKAQGESLDDHQASSKGVSQEDLDKLMERAEEFMKEQFPEKTEEEIKEQIEKGLQDVGLTAGAGEGKDVLAEYFEKRKVTWKHFAKRFIKAVYDDKEETLWIPNRRTHDLCNTDMFLPAYRDQDIENKVQVVLFLDTSGSCGEYKKHFLGFAKAIPADLFDVHAFGFNRVVYSVDLKNPKFKGGGTNFQEFQKYMNTVPGKRKYAFVFTDGYGNNTKLDHPENWHWFLFSKGSTRNYIPKGCQTHCLDNFE